MIIGRKEEIRQLTHAYESAQSEFIAIYGRRRDGKTFLVRLTFENNFAFSYSGMANVTTHEQLQKFYLTLKKHGVKENAYPLLKSVDNRNDLPERRIPVIILTLPFHLLARS